MNRRRYLALAGGGLAGLAGCLGLGGGSNGDTGDPGGGTTPTGSTGSAGGTPGSSGLTDVELPLPESELSRGAPKDAIPAITDPAFGSDWSGVSASLSADSRVIGVERAGEARAYPLAVFNWHEVVNDTFDGPLLVTFCPLCGSGVTAVRKVGGDVTTFGVSGLLWQSDLVMYDEKTGSLWSQILAQAVRGPETGTRLDLVPSTMTTWGGWREEHPDSKVLLPPPESGTVVGEVNNRNYNRNPYSSYEESGQIGIGQNDFDDDRLHPKTTVVGVTNDGVSRAYPLERVRAEGGVVNDRVNGLPVVVAADDDGTLAAYERAVDGSTLSFKPAVGLHIRAGGSRFGLRTGRAVDGPLEGTTLTKANDRSQMFWFAWADFHPDSEIFGQ